MQTVAVYCDGSANPTFENSFSALRSIVFVLKGAFAFPSIRVGMENPSNYSASVLVATCDK